MLAKCILEIYRSKKKYIIISMAASVIRWISQQLNWHIMHKEALLQNATTEHNGAQQWPNHRAKKTLAWHHSKSLPSSGPAKAHKTSVERPENASSQMLPIQSDRDWEYQVKLPKFRCAKLVNTYQRRSRNTLTKHFRFHFSVGYWVLIGRQNEKWFHWKCNLQHNKEWK